MRLHHIGWVGRDLERIGRRLMREGATPLGEPVVDPLQRVTVQFFSDGSGALVWEAIAPLEGEASGPLVARLQRGGGLDHVCFELSSADGSLEDVLVRATADGGVVVCPPVYAVAFGRRIAFVLFGNGRKVEYVETDMSAVNSNQLTSQYNP